MVAFQAPTRLRKRLRWCFLSLDFTIAVDFDVLRFELRLNADLAAVVQLAGRGLLLSLPLAWHVARNEDSASRVSLIDTASPILTIIELHCQIIFNSILVSLDKSLHNPIEDSHYGLVFILRLLVTQCKV